MILLSLLFVRNQKIANLNGTIKLLQNAPMANNLPQTDHKSESYLEIGV